VIRCAISSPLRRRRRNARGPVCGGISRTIVVAAADILLNQRNRLSLLIDYFLGKLRVSEAFIVFLAFRQHPFQKIFDSFTFGCILNLRRNQ
jgi:hypothetical protein